MHLVLIFIGLALLIPSLVKLLRYFATKNWRQVEGVLIDLQFGTAKERIKYSFLEYVFPKVEYEYSVGGKIYRSRRVALDVKNAWSPVDATQEPKWKDWEKNGRVTVYYEVKRPADAVLILQLMPRRRSHLPALVIAGTLLILVGGIVARISV